MDKARLDGLLALKVVAEKRNFTAAAERFGISPSAISQTIRSVESRLGVTLLNRTTRSISLTEAGQKFMDQAGPAIDQINAVLDDISNYAKKPSGLLRLNLPRAIYPHFLGPIINNFVQKFSEISVEVFFEDQQSDVVENGFDAGIRLYDILAQDMVAVKLYGPIRFVIAGSPEYFDRVGRPAHPKDLISHNCLRVRLDRSYIYDQWEFESEGNEFVVQIRGSLIFNDFFVSKDAAVKGMGIIYTTEDAIRDRVDSNELEIVLREFSAVSPGFYLYYPKRSQVSLKLRVFIDFIKLSLEK